MNDFIDFVFQQWKEHLIIGTIVFLMVAGCLSRAIRGKDLF